MMLSQAFVIAIALLIGGNIIIRLAGLRKLHFIYNSALLVSLSSIIGLMIYTKYSALEFGFLSFNPFSLFIGMIVSIAMLLISFISFNYKKEFEDATLLSSFVISGMYAVIFSTNFVAIFLGIELMTLPSVFMILLEERKIEAAMKLFIMASISIAIFSFALVLFYGATGSIALNHVAIQKSTMLALALILFIVALGFEASVFPFNVWVPDVYTGASSYISAMLGGVNKKVGFAALMLALFVAFSAYVLEWRYIIAAFAVLTMFYGNLVAIKQENVKRMLAYSSISQAGYIMIGIAAASNLGATASLIQIFAHAFAFIGIFAIISWLESQNRKLVNDFIGLSRENPLAAFAISIMMLSLIGMPFTIGFIGKFLLFTSAISEKMLWLALLGIINSIISIYYYARVMAAAYTNKVEAHKLKMDLPTAAVVLICLAIVILFGVYPSGIVSLASNAGNYLLYLLYGSH